MKYLLLFGTLFFHLTVFAQRHDESQIDSLKTVLENERTDSNKVLILVALSGDYTSGNPEEGKKYASLALELAQRSGWEYGIALANNSLGNNSMYQSDYASAMDLFFKSLKEYEKINNKNGQAKELGNIGLIYYYQSNLPQALTYNLRSLEMSRQLDDDKDVAIDLVNIGNIYQSLDSIDLSFRYYNDARRLYESQGKTIELAPVLCNLGQLYQLQNNYPKALEYDAKALGLTEKYGIKNVRAVILGNIGEIYLQEAKGSQTEVAHDTLPGPAKAIEKAFYYLTEAITLDKQINYLKGLQNAYLNLSETQAIMGKYKDAYSSHLQYVFWKDSVFSPQKAQKIAALGSQWELDAKDKQIKINKLEAEKNRMAFTQKRNENIFFIAGIIVLTGAVLFISYERKRSDKLLRNILPAAIAKRLKNREHPIADHFADASVLFCDIARFTQFSEKRDPKEVVTLLNSLFSQFDILAQKHGLEKIKTIGDCYMAVSGVPTPMPGHADAAAAMALEIKQYMKGYAAPDGTEIQIRIGLDCGPVVAGVIGSRKFIYDIWGDTVNTASRMESTGVTDEINCTDTFKNALKGEYELTSRGAIDVKGKGMLQAWIIS